MSLTNLRYDSRRWIDYHHTADSSVAWHHHHPTRLPMHYIDLIQHFLFELGELAEARRGSRCCAKWKFFARFQIYNVRFFKIEWRDDIPSFLKIVLSANVFGNWWHVDWKKRVLLLVLNSQINKFTFQFCTNFGFNILR